MELIDKNPYRILGVFSNASLKEITANKTKLARYASVGKSVSFDADMGGVLPSVTRTAESVEKAFADLSLPLDRLKHALFWFVNDTDFDKMTLGHLSEENYDDTEKLFTESKKWSGLINASTLALIKNDFGKAISCITQVIHVSSYRAAMVNAICGDTFQIEESELAKLFVDSLRAIKPMNDLYRLFMSYGSAASDVEYLKACMTKEPVEKLNNEINKAKTVREDGVAIYEAGVTLQRNAMLLLEQLKVPLGAESVEYKLNFEKYAKAVLKCCIDSFKALQKEVEDGKFEHFRGYAPKVKALLVSIDTSLVSEVTKERIEINLKTVSEIVDDLDDYVLRNSQICYFCEKNKADPSAQIKKTMYRETWRGPDLLGGNMFDPLGHSGFRTRIYYKQAEIGINRCEHCKEIHDKDHNIYQCPRYNLTDHPKLFIVSIVVPLLIIGVIVGIVSKSVIVSLSVCLLLGWIPILINVLVIESVFNRKIKAKYNAAILEREKLKVKKVSDINQHPVIKKLLKEGWSDHKPL